MSARMVREILEGLESRVWAPSAPPGATMDPMEPVTAPIITPAVRITLELASVRLIP